MRRTLWTTALVTCVVSLACRSEPEPAPVADTGRSDHESPRVTPEPEPASSESAGEGAAAPESPSTSTPAASATDQADSGGDAVVVLGADVVDGFYARTPPFVQTSEWLGLFAEGDAWSLRTVDIAWTVTPDSEPDEDVVLHEMRTTPEAPLLIFGDVAALGPGPVVTVAPYGASLDASSSEVPLALGDVRYVARLTTSDGMGCDAVVTLTDGATTQELYAPAEGDPCDEPHFDVNWAGDLDGDGRLDLVVTFSPKYSMHPRRLYLSSAAGPGELVAPVALYDRQA